MRQTDIIKSYLIPVAAFALLAACTAEEPQQVDDITMPRGAMLFSGGMGWIGEEPAEAPVTRVDGHEPGENANNPYLISTSRNDHWHDGQIVYFTKKSDSGDSQSDYYSRYVYNETAGQFKSEDPLIWKQLTEDVCAFYRGDMGMLGQHYVKLTANFSVKQDQSEDEDYQASDFVFFRGNVSYNNGVEWAADGRVTNIVFDHKVAQLRLNIFSRDNETFDPKKIDSTHVYIGNRHFGISATVLTNAAYANSYTTTQNLLTRSDTQNKTMVMNHNHNGVKDGKKYAQYRLFMIPQNLVETWAGTSAGVTQDGYISRFIQFKYDGIWYYCTIRISDAVNVFRNLQQGKYHTFNITFVPRTTDTGDDDYDLTPEPGQAAGQ